MIGHTTMETIKKRRPYKRLPCINCISFPICISIFRRVLNEEGVLFGSNYRFISLLSNKCSLVEDYIYITKGENKINRFRYRSFYRIKKLAKYFYKSE